LASVGYYIGGMSEAQLKQSEKKQVILASYSMCQEGLDISTLNAEFLLTPKTDIVQTVGRILRAKHAHCLPVIYDFVDSHDLFQRQWLKRKAYYKKQNYTIVATTSMNYSPNIVEWKQVYPSIKREKKKGKKSQKKTVSSLTEDSDQEEEEEEEEEEEDEEDDESCNEKKSVFAGKCFIKLKH